MNPNPKPFNLGPVYGNIMGAFILLTNVAFLLVTAWTLLKLANWGAVKRFINSVLRRVPCCRGKTQPTPAHLMQGQDSAYTRSCDDKDPTVLPA
jgi:hypothetical protein